MKTSTKKIFLLAAIGLASTLQLVSGQSAVYYYSQPMLPLHQKIPAFPVSVQEAYKLVQIKEVGEGKQTLEPNASFLAAREQLRQLQAKIQQSASMLAQAPATGPSSSQLELAKKMEDPAFQEKLAAMSDDEKLAFAMQLQQSMSESTAQPPVGPVDDAVSLALEQLAEVSYQLFNNESLIDSNVKPPFSHRIPELMQALQAHQAEIGDWERQEINKLPLRKGDITMEGSPGKEPQKVKDIKLAAVNKKIAHFNQQLRRLSVEWNEEMAFLKQQLLAADEAFASINYYEELEDRQMQTTFMGYQVNILRRLMEQYGSLESIVLPAATLEFEKNRLENAPLLEFEGQF